MAFNDLDQRHLDLIDQRIGEDESARKRVDWSIWSPRAVGATAFCVLFLLILVLPAYESATLSKVTGLAILVVSATVLYGIYLLRFRPTLYRDPKRHALFATSILVSAGLLQLLVRFPPTESVSAEIHAALVPALTFVFLLTNAIVYSVVFDQRFGFDGLVALTLALGVVLLGADAFDALTMVVSLAGAFASVLFTKNLRSRYKLALVGVFGGGVTALAILALYLLGVGRFWQSSESLSGFAAFFWAGVAVVLGASVGVFTTFLLPLFERMFGITTDVRLIELLEGQHPLITLMQQRAPGTWQHTQNVANFTKRACDAIGANSLLGEVGVRFHDLGKMVRPEYFTENEPDSKVLHDALSPMMSAMIILSHVSDGVLMARKAKLPPIIEDFITGHHGTSVIKYFYYKAKEIAQEGEPVNEGMFRYPGPKPQCKESAIAAVADQVEATARSRFAAGVTHPDAIREMVRDSINGKLLDGQFDECDITRAELKKVEDSLVSSLAGMYHHRVKYPDDPDKKKRQEAVEAREKYRRDLAKRRQRILTQ